MSSEGDSLKPPMVWIVGILYLELRLNSEHYQTNSINLWSIGL